MDITPLPLGSSLTNYEQQAEGLLEAWRAGNATAVRLIRETHPRFLDDRIPWLPKKLSDAEVRSVTLDPSDARLAIARWYSFQDWSRLAEWVAAVAVENSPVARFESAVEAVVSGDLAALERLLDASPELVRARSTIVT
jgi:hypothetical protein